MEKSDSNEELEVGESQMFQEAASTSEDQKQDEVKVARPTTKPTDRTKKLEKQTYNFWTEKDPEKLNTFPQFADPTHIAPKKLDDPDLIKQFDQATDLRKTNSAWNKAGTWEDKKLKIDTIKKYLIDQKMVIGDSNRKLMLTDIKTIKGEASIAVVRGQPRMGYELSITAELTGVEGTYMEGCTVDVEIEELCDDSTEPANSDLSVTKLLDTEQGSQAKDMLGYDNEMDVYCKEITKLLKEYPQRAE